MFIFVIRWGVRNGLIGCFAFGVMGLAVISALYASPVMRRLLGEDFNS